MPNMYRSNPTLKFAVHENLSIFNRTKACNSDDISNVFVTKACSDDNRYSFWSAVTNIVVELPIRTSADRVCKNCKCNVLTQLKTYFRDENEIEQIIWLGYNISIIAINIYLHNTEEISYIQWNLQTSLLRIDLSKNYTNIQGQTPQGQPVTKPGTSLQNIIS